MATSTFLQEMDATMNLGTFILIMMLKGVPIAAVAVTEAPSYDECSVVAAEFRETAAEMRKTDPTIPEAFFFCALKTYKPQLDWFPLQSDKGRPS